MPAWAHFVVYSHQSTEMMAFCSIIGTFKLIQLMIPGVHIIQVKNSEGQKKTKKNLLDTFFNLSDIRWGLDVEHAEVVLQDTLDLFR